jgi:hypothetical protein
MRSLLVLFPLLLFGSATLAQPGSAEPSNVVLQSCLLGTGPDMWAKLKLSQDQMRRMAHIQEACRLECEAAGVVVPNPAVTDDGAMIMDDVRMVLSTEQYTNWVAYCRGIGGGK